MSDFLFNYFKQGLCDTRKGLIGLIANFDPERASAADIRCLEDALSADCLLRAKADDQRDKVVAAFNEKKAAYDEELKMAQAMQAKITGTDNQDEKATWTGRLAKVRTKVDEMVPELTDLKENLADAEAYFQQIDQYTEEAAEKLKKAKARVEKDLRELERSKREAVQAKERSEGAAMAAGLRDAAGDGDNAHNAIQGQIAKNRQQAAANTHKAELLTPKVEHEDAETASLRAELAGTTKPVDHQDWLDNLPKF